MKVPSSSIPTSELQAYLPHRPPMVWVDEVVSYEMGTEGPLGVCRVNLDRKRHYCSDDGSVRASSVIEWIAQAYGFVKACHFRAQNSEPQRLERAFLVGITDCEVDLAGIEKEHSVLVHVKEVRNLHPAYLLEGSVTDELMSKSFGKARLKVFGG